MSNENALISGRGKCFRPYETVDFAFMNDYYVALVLEYHHAKLLEEPAKTFGSFEKVEYFWQWLIKYERQRHT